MKYAITGPRGRINRVLDEPNDRTVEITDEQAALVADATSPDGYFVIEGEFITAAEFRQREKAKRQAERIVAMSPEEKAAYEAQLQSKAAYDAASTIFEAMPLGKQALWKGVREQVGKLILAGDMATAKELLETVPALYPDAETDRELFLELFL